MTTLLVRHAEAGDRSTWRGDDRVRPLDERGHRQALALVDELAPYRVDRILSSPYLRCIQTVEPLSAARGIPIEPRDELGEQRQEADGLVVVRALDDEAAVVCTHGGLPWDSLADAYKKGSVLVLGKDGAVECYLPPPA